MKEIAAVIRQSKMNETKAALANLGIRSFTARRVLGRGRGHVDFRVLAAAADGTEEAVAQLGQGPLLMPKRMLSIVLPDDKLEEAVAALIRANQSGKAGDGKIFVLPVLDAIRVRTGETGAAALNQDF